MRDRQGNVSSWPKRRIGQALRHTEIVEQGKRLAREIMADPSLFEADLQDWVTDQDAQNAGDFLHALGELDCRQIGLEVLEARIDRPGGVFALGVYVAGWYAAAPTEGGAYLDSIAGRGDRWSDVAVEATSRIEGSLRGVTRLLRCVAKGGINRGKMAGILRWGVWDQPLTIESYLALVTGLRDGTPDVNRALLYALYQRWLVRRDDWNQLGPVVLAVLFNTMASGFPRHDRAAWDSLASALVKWNVDEACNLLFAHFTKGERGSGIFLTRDRQELLQVLSLRDRPRLVRRLLETALAYPDQRLELELRELLLPETDAPVLFQFVEQYGLEAARLVAKHLDADQPGFWEMLPTFIARWGHDEAVRTGVLHSMTWGYGFSEDRRSTLESRRIQGEQLVDHPDPLVRDVARQAREAIAWEIQTRELT